MGFQPPAALRLYHPGTKDVVVSFYGSLPNTAEPIITFKPGLCNPHLPVNCVHLKFGQINWKVTVIAST